ncbi:hypothetical protein [Vibrio gazogenes]|uniref:Uncharacterized protein n=1 Tax=Vibrio gazogenes DSM 21264 = NBRC 103151 TaxID=1123492 RepID=A0A1M4XYL1_VIBGA|nr:hypothetical protein [Vibrio gazogenes]USP12834.1 hypothetical protein MKS89_10330 [Vibrio gazogenes]SHE98674.1 hypothetical protein SAMN02745781_01222 [Vibrio gazogenes DSM 21264] [Vibrio gazogenes DSM 21264 = NBRC 103151]SJN58813.1 hypothetical protein BQ6471_03198 [Vibrio gazogenes]
MNMNPREYLPILSEREPFFDQLDDIEIKHQHYKLLHEEFKFLTNDLFTIMSKNRTLSKCNLVIEKLTELRVWLISVMSNHDEAKMLSQQMLFSLNLTVVSDSDSISTKNAMSARLSLLTQLNRVDSRHQYFQAIHAEFCCFVDDLYIIMKNNNTLLMYKLITEKLAQVRKWLVLVMSNKEQAAASIQPIPEIAKKVVHKSETADSEDSASSDTTEQEQTIDEFLEEFANLMKS